MADPQDTKLQQLQLKEIETQLASVEQRMQRLALLKKSIELKLIDPQDSQRFDQFLKKLATADTSNIESLRGYITGAADKFDELIYANKTFAKESESVLKTFVRTDRQFANIAGTFDTINRSVIKLNIGLEEANELVDEYVKGVKESLEEYLDLDVVQTSIEKNMHKINQAQKTQIKNAFGLNSSYDTVSDSLSDINQQLKDVNTPIRKMIQFDIGAVGSIEQDLQQVKAGIGKESFTFEMPDIDGKIIKKQLDAGFVEPMLRGIVGGGEILAKNMSDRIDVLKKIIEKKSGETSEIVKAMIEDLEAKQMDPNAQILSPDMQGKVEAAWGRIQKKGNAALMDLIGGTVQSSQKLKLLTARLEAVNTEIDVMAEKREKLAKTFDMLDRSLDTSIESLQYATRNMMPNWLYQTLGLDSAFQDISNTAKQGLSEAAAKIAQGGSAAEALSGFAGSFATNLFKSLGPLALIAIALTGLWSMMTSAGEAAKELSKEFGVSRSTAVDMYKSILNMTAALDNTELKQEDILEVLKKHRDEYGVIMDLNNKANQEAIKFAGQLGKQYGIGAGEAYGFTQQLERLGADQAASQEIAAMAAYASDLAGVPFNNIVKDLAESSEFVATQFAGYPQKAVAAAAKIRAMGGSLKQVEKAMEKAFDVSSFLKGMTELNIMTRGVVDLSEYFKLATSGADATTQFKELTKQFDKMVASGQTNMFQMRQFAQVTGQSVDELLRGNKLRQKQAELGKDNVELLSKYLDKLSDADVADAKSAMQAAKRLGAAEKLDTVWASIKDTLTQALLPVLEAISDTIITLAPLLKIIGAIIKGIVAPFKFIYDIGKSFFELLSGDGKAAGETLSSMFEKPTSFMDLLLKGVQLFIAYWTSTKLLGGIGKVVGKFTGMGDQITGWGPKIKALGSTISSNLGNAFDAFKSGGSITDKLKNAGKSLFQGKTAEGVEDAAPTSMIDKVKGMFGLGGESVSPLQQPADELTNAAERLKDAADALSGTGSSITDMATEQTKGKGKGRKGNARRQRAGRIGTPKTTATSIPSPKTAPSTGRFGKIKNIASKGADAIKNVGSKGLKLGKAIGPGALTAIAGMGLEHFGGKYEEEAMKTGDQGTMNKARAAKVGGRALEGAGMGAMVGSIIPGLGTAVGGAIGGALGGAFGLWENYFSDDAKRQNEQLKQIKNGNKLLNGLTDLTESEKDQLKQAGYSDELIEKISQGNISLEDAIKEQFSEFKFSDDQLKKLTDPKTTGEERDIIMRQASDAAGVPTPSLAVGTNLVQSDGLAMLHKGEAIVPAKVLSGGFDDSGIKESGGMFTKIMKNMFNMQEDLQPIPQKQIESQKIAPVKNPMTNIQDAAVQTQDYASQMNAQQTMRPSANQDALLKQLLTAMQDVANRPVQVEIGGVELKSLNRKMKVYNNKA